MDSCSERGKIFSRELWQWMKQLLDKLLKIMKNNNFAFSILFFYMRLFIARLTFNALLNNVLMEYFMKYVNGIVVI